MDQHKDTNKKAGFVLPASLIGNAEVARLIREIEKVDGDIEAQKVRGESLRLPPISQGLSDFLSENKIDPADAKALAKLKEDLRKMKDKAPVIHMTFASEVDPYLLQKLVIWLREHIHPNAFVSVGLQPSLIGGVYVRTPNHVFDFSLKAVLKGKRGVIQNELEALRAR
jgi:hypothetical protein